MDDAAVGSLVVELRRLHDVIDRPGPLGRLEITVSVKGSLDEERVEKLAALGVDRLVVVPRRGFEGSRLVDWVVGLRDQLRSVTTRD